MAVQVQQPTRKKRDLFDVLLGGLQAASAITNIQKARAELEAIPEAKARLQRAEERGFAAQFKEVPEGTPGGIALTAPGQEKTGLFLPRAEIAATKKAEKAAEKESKEALKQTFDEESKTRKEWESNLVTKATRDVASAAGKVAKVAGGPPSAAGDISLVFSYMKLLDPGSVVREGEQALARNAAGVPDIVRNQYNRLLKGETLAPAQRKDFAKRAVELYDVHWQQQQTYNEQMRGIAERRGLDTRNVVLELGLEPAEFNRAIEQYLSTTEDLPPGQGQKPRTEEEQMDDFDRLFNALNPFGD